MDTKKQEILKLALEAKEIKKNKKSEEFYIKVLGKEIETLKRTIEKNNIKIKNNCTLESEFEVLNIDLPNNKIKLIGAFVVAVVAGGVSFSIAPVIPVDLLFVTGLFATLYELKEHIKIKKRKKKIIKEITDDDNAKEKDIDLSKIIDNKNRLLIEENKENRNVIYNKQKELKEEQEKRKNNDKRYLEVQNNIRDLTKERNELIDSLLEEYESPILDIRKPLYKEKRIISTHK